MLVIPPPSSIVMIHLSWLAGSPVRSSTSYLISKSGGTVFSFLIQGLEPPRSLTNT